MKAFACVQEGLTLAMCAIATTVIFMIGLRRELGCLDALDATSVID